MKGSDWRTALKKSWHVILFLVLLMFTMIFVAQYTEALPLIIILWIVVPVMLLQLWRWAKRKIEE